LRRGLGGGSRIYISAIALIANFSFFVSGAWLLIVGRLGVGTEP
jgi:hypothetical protein